ncbi:probable beta-D-xylosidase 5 [Cryptomeria japonica]|uniref:probable beta-D-xylosidase 5 n=1 Tax=Cryptomeria japonica TaxID=3369 RepID=UPI0027D9FC40|nr:probable beta-D-xylosidase 5 [Cryptomeria japonica]
MPGIMNWKCWVCVIAAVIAATVFRCEGDEIYVCDPMKFEMMGKDIKQFAFCDSSLGFEERAIDLVSRMTLQEKVGQMGSTSTGVPRLGLPKYEWWSEGLHGVSNTGPGIVFDQRVPGATSFPLVILSAASFNETLWRVMGEIVSTEARGMHNSGTAGLTYWSPNINLLRDPRWGRAQETPGEDPLVVSRYAVNYVRGLQDTSSSSSNMLKVASCCKHYTAYDLDAWKGIDRLHFDAEVTQQDMLDTFQPPFEACVTQGAGSCAMCSFNKINGIPSCADPQLLKNTVRGEWNLNGYIVADCDSIQVLFQSQMYVKTPEDAVAYVLRSGLDLDCEHFYTDYLLPAVVKGKVKESDIDRALVYTYTTLMRLGFFDGSKEYASLGAKDVCTPEHQELAVEAARQSIVLLKNDGSLPLSTSKITTLAVIGPHANATQAMIGNYAGVPCKYTSPIDGLEKYTKIDYKLGCYDVACGDTSLIPSAVEASRKADTTVLVVGYNLTFEAEGHDREDLLLPGQQQQLVAQVAFASKGPVILVVMTGSAVDISFAQKSGNISGILWVGYPGQGGGDAIAQLIFGTHSPGGRLPMTWYPNQYAEIVNMTDMHMRANLATQYPGRTYRFYTGDTLYPFGYGLSYTSFQYTIKSQSSQFLKVHLPKNQKCYSLFESSEQPVSNCPSIRLEDKSSKNLCKDLEIQIQVEIKNSGTRDGSEVVLLYVVPPSGRVGAPVKQLISFQRVFLTVGSSEVVVMKINACDSLGLVDNAGYKILPAGTHTLMIGQDSTNSISVNATFLPTSPPTVV